MNLKDLNKLISESLSVSESEIKESSDLRNISTWDSMNHILLIAKLEDNYNVLFTGDEIIEMTDLNTIKKFLIQKGIS